jgi:hypothetical protein
MKRGSYQSWFMFMAVLSRLGMGRFLLCMVSQNLYKYDYLYVKSSNSSYRYEQIGRAFNQRRTPCGDSKYSVSTMNLAPINNQLIFVQLSFELVRLPCLSSKFLFKPQEIFLTILKDLLDEAKANNEPPSNFGLHDQRN